MTDLKLDEVQIKALVLSKLRRDGVIDAGTPIASEFRLGNAPARADLAMFGRTFVGVEIKSELDSLRRFDSQMEIYRQHFERLIVVVATRHLKAISSREVYNADLWHVGDSGEIVVLSRRIPEKRKAGFSPLMTQEEQRKFIKGRDQFKTERAAFAAAFAARYSATSANFWAAVSGRPISQEDVQMLSRFREVRRRQSAFEQRRIEQRIEWCARATEILKVA